MAKLLRTRDRILLGLSFVADVLDEVRLAGGIVPRAYKEMYGFIPAKYKKDNLYCTINRMLKANLVERVIEGGEPKFRLTSIGKKRITRDFPLIQLQKRRWDRRWRVAIFDIPEETRTQRNKLRAKLEELGFGMIQKSVWVSPHPFEDDVRELLTTWELDEYVYLFISDAAFTGNIADLVEKVWHIEELNSAYEEIAARYRGEWGEPISKRKFLSKFINLSISDPFLPRELLPDPWWGDEARGVFKKIAKTTL